MATDIGRFGDLPGTAAAVIGGYHAAYPQLPA